METNIPFGNGFKREIAINSSHKVLPANKVDKESMLIRPITSNTDKILRRENQENKSQIQYINYSPIKKKSYLQTLKDKIFSPGDFIPTKNESKNQKLIIELSKKLLASSSLLTKNSDNQNSKAKIKTSLKYLPEKSYFNSKKKTLILDLDETLVHSAFKPFYFKSDIILNMTFDQKTHTIHVLKRPYVDEFLDKMSKLYELVIFTASIPEYANPLLDQLDPRKRICYRLFREHCTPSNSFFIKDLKKVGRDLKNTIIIDNNPVSYVLNKDNGIPILTWHSSKNDSELVKLIPLLEYLAKVDDVRDCIKKVINGNYVNFREVNKLINGANGNNKQREEEKAQSFFSISPNDLNSLKENNSKKINGISDTGDINNINLLKNKLGSYYFDDKEKKVGEKIRESLNLNFDTTKKTSPNNLFEDKLYQEKYNQFYETKNTGSISSNSDFYSRAYEKLDKDLVLPSNNCRSSSKNIKMKKFNNTNNKNLFSSSLKHNESYSNLTNDKESTYTHRQLDHSHLPVYVSPVRDNKTYDLQNKQSSLSKSLERRQFEFGLGNRHSRPHYNESKISRFTTQTATISLQDKGNEGGFSSSSLNYLSWNLNSYNYKVNGKSTGITKRNLSHTLRERLNHYTNNNLSIKPQAF